MLNVGQTLFQELYTDKLIYYLQQPHEVGIITTRPWHMKNNAGKG